MIASRGPKHVSVIASAAVLAAAIAAPLAGTDAGQSPTTPTARSPLPNGKTDVIKAMGNIKGWEADVTPTAKQNRGRYQLRLDQAHKLTT